MAIRHSRVFRTWIITPAGTSYDEANALALEQAKAWITGDQTIEMGGVTGFSAIPMSDQEELWLAEFTVLPPV
jgi:hypothetical protein